MGKLDDWLQRKLGGHISFGPVTVYGFNAMHVAVSIWTKRWGAVCFHPDLRFLGRLAPWMLGKEWPWYFYLSPNHTPWASTFAVGPGVERETKIDAIRRWAMWGHNYEGYDPQKETEYFWEYVQSLKRAKEEREAADGKCGACGSALTPVESASSNVCLKCLLSSMERVAAQIRQQEAMLQDPNPEQHQDPDSEGWN